MAVSSLGGWSPIRWRAAEIASGSRRRRRPCGSPHTGGGRPPQSLDFVDELIEAAVDDRFAGVVALLDLVAQLADAFFDAAQLQLAPLTLHFELFRQRLAQLTGKLLSVRSVI